MFVFYIFIWEQMKTDSPNRGRQSAALELEPDLGATTEESSLCVNKCHCTSTEWVLVQCRKCREMQTNKYWAWIHLDKTALFVECSKEKLDTYLQCSYPIKTELILLCFYYSVTFVVNLDEIWINFLRKGDFFLLL